MQIIRHFSGKLKKSKYYAIMTIHGPTTVDEIILTFQIRVRINEIVLLLKKII